MTLKKIFTKSKVENNKLKEKIAVMLTWLPLQNNPFLLCIEVNGLKKPVSQLNMEVFQPVSEKKLVPMEKTTGVFSESINSKKLNNSFFVNLKTLGKFMKKWSLYLKNSIKLFNFHTELLTSSLELWMMLLPRNTTWKPGSQDITATENLSLAQTVLTSNPEISMSELELKRKT